MHISIPHDLFLKSIEKGGLAIFGSDDTDEGLRETIPTQRCVKITARKGGLVIESSVSKANAIYSFSDDSLKISEEGELCVDAVELRSNLKFLKYPHTVYFELDKKSINPKAGEPSDSIVPLGKVIFKAVNDVGREAFKLELTAYSPKDFIQTSYSEGKEPALKIQSKALREAIGLVAFASGADQVTELFDHICIISKSGKTHIAATDNKRAALMTLDATSFEGDAEGHPILVDAKLTQGIMAQMPSDSTLIEFVLDDDDEHITFKTKDLKVRASMPPSSTRTRFPTFANAIDMPIGASVVFEPYREIEQTISRLVATSNMGVFSFKPGDNEIEVKCWNSTVSGKIGCKGIEKGLNAPMILPLKFIEDIVKKLPDAGVKFSFSQDEKRVIVQSVDSLTPFYLMQRNTPTEV